MPRLIFSLSQCSAAAFYGTAFIVVCGLLSGGCNTKPANNAPNATAQPDSHKTVAHEDHGSRGTAGGHENMNMDSVARRMLVIETEPTLPVAGSTTKLILRIEDEQVAAVKQFDLLHEKLVHLIVVRDGLDEFAHLHPNVDASGTR